jgi:hypothetical protein
MRSRVLFSPLVCSLRSSFLRRIRLRPNSDTRMEFGPIF